MQLINQVTTPVGRVVRAARRPATYAGQLRELSSTVVTAGMWPFGFSGSQLPAERDGEPTVETPVLLLHGYGANKSNWLFVTHHLRQAGFRRVRAFNYNPLTADIPGLAAQCVAEADALRDHYGVDRVHLIGHSFGGVIARYAIQVLGLEGVTTCLTVASPHGGIDTARLSSLFGGLPPLRSVHDLRPEAPVMTLLRSTSRPLPTRFVAYYSNLDLIVPAARAMITDPELGAENILVKDHGHLSIMLSRRLSASVVDHLAAAEGLPGHRPLRPRTSAPSAPSAPTS